MLCYCVILKYVVGYVDFCVPRTFARKTSTSTSLGSVLVKRRTFIRGSLFSAEFTEANIQAED